MSKKQPTFKGDNVVEKPEIEACAGRVANYAHEVANLRGDVSLFEQELVDKRAMLATAMLNHLSEFSRLKDLSQIPQPTI